MQPDAALLARIDSLTSAMQLMAQALGTRLTREQLAQRLGIHRNTLRERMARDALFPRPGVDGRWLLSEVVEWEQQQLR